MPVAGCLAPKSTPYPRQKPTQRDPTGVAPSILAYGIHSFFLPTILRVRLAASSRAVYYDSKKSGPVMRFSQVLKVRILPLLREEKEVTTFI